MITRIIAEPIARTKKSILLLGPRQVGKSTLIQTLQPDLSINFANEIDFMTHSSRPEELGKLISIQAAKTIFIDEVQRIPQILNTVQALVDAQKNLKFYLTGSSARKLKRGGANLLPGRVLNFRLGPLIASELSYQMDTKKILSLGSLPEIYLENDQHQAQELLKSYAANYLKEEIKAEALTRSLDSFSRFLSEAILSAGQFIDHTKMAKKTRISRHAIPRYFEILEDTLIGHRIFPFEPLAESLDLIRHPKFYLFDTGVYNGVLQNFTASADRVGALSEQLVLTQLLHSAWAQNLEIKMSSFRTRKGIEVDFIIELKDRPIAIEVKSTDNIHSDDCEGLLFFKKHSSKNSQLFIFHMGIKEAKLGPIWILPWQKGLRELGL